jgi:alkylation response protein AidB-like acyl-CoA dehydrogenase
MDLTPNDEQIAFQTATADWCRDNMALEGARARPEGQWAELEAMGWTGMTAPGMDLDHATEALVFAELGRFLAPIGLISTAVASRWFPDAAKGKVALALAASEPAPLRVLDPAGSGAVLMGEPGGLRLFDLPDSSAHTKTHAPTIDLSTLQSRHEWTTSLWTGDDPAPPLHLQLLSAAYAVGCADAARDMAADYARLREQFDRPIGWFQALKHICSDMAVRAAAARSQLYFAACALDENAADVAFHVAAAKRLADQAALENGRANIQVHGGIGMTDEAAAHLPLKRAHLLQFIAPAAREALLA